MRNRSKKRTISVISTLLSVAGVAAPLTAIVGQPPAKVTVKLDKVSDVLSRMAENGGLGPIEFLREQGTQNRATVDSLVTGLEQLIFTAKTPMRRSEAAFTLAVAGTGEVPLSGMVNRLANIYRRSSDAEVRAAILSMMQQQRDRTRAIAFLKSIAVEVGGHPDLSGPWGAVTALSHMNGEGVAALKDLRDAHAVTDPRARGYVDWYLGRK